ncbi:MAG: hypothetical protein KKG60_03145 [Nanoarchaeota archaeon]|nr:hypothetical protein [Nanoarchaeota archaeon]
MKTTKPIKTRELLKKLKGIQTIPSVMTNLNINRQKAVYCIYRLRKQGYVKTKRQSTKKRIYYVSFENKLGGSTYEELINKNSPIKISVSGTHQVYGRTPTPEEALIYALKTKNFRTILASLGLFRKIKDWKLLYHLAKQNNLRKEIGALYELSRKRIRTRRTTKTFLNQSSPEKTEKYKYILPNMKSKDFNEIQKKWRVYIPFNKKDLEVYNTGI